MKAPFIGTRVLEKIKVHEVIELIDCERLFASRWQFRKKATSKEWEDLKQSTIIPVFNRIAVKCEARNIIEPKLVYGYFECQRQENALLVTPPLPSTKPILRFEFPRSRKPPHLCIADFFPDGFIAMQIATVGQRVIEEGARLFNEKNYSEAFYLKGFAAEAAEATAEYGHRHILKELGLTEKQGCRYSFGYPSAPNLFDQKKLYVLLEAKRIEVQLTETCQLVPEYSTSAIISPSPDACLFMP